MAVIAYTIIIAEALLHLGSVRMSVVDRSDYYLRHVRSVLSISDIMIADTVGFNVLSTL